MFLFADTVSISQRICWAQRDDQGQNKGSDTMEVVAIAESPDTI